MKRSSLMVVLINFSLSNLLSCVNSSANFLLYMLRGKKFRDAFCQTYFRIFCKCCRKKNRSGESPIVSSSAVNQVFFHQHFTISFFIQKCVVHHVSVRVIIVERNFGAKAARKMSVVNQFAVRRPTSQQLQGRNFTNIFTIFFSQANFMIFNLYCSNPNSYLPTYELNFKCHEEKN